MAGAIRASFGGGGAEDPASAKLRALEAEYERVQRQQAVLRDAVTRGQSVVVHPATRPLPGALAADPPTPDPDEEDPATPGPRYKASGGLPGFKVAVDLLELDFSPPADAPAEYRALAYDAGPAAAPLAPQKSGFGTLAAGSPELVDFLRRLEGQQRVIMRILATGGVDMGGGASAAAAALVGAGAADVRAKAEPAATPATKPASFAFVASAGLAFPSRPPTSTPAPPALAPPGPGPPPSAAPDHASFGQAFSPALPPSAAVPLGRPSCATLDGAACGLGLAASYAFLVWAAVAAGVAPGVATGLTATAYTLEGAWLLLALGYVASYCRRIDARQVLRAGSAFAAAHGLASVVVVPAGAPPRAVRVVVLIYCASRDAERVKAALDAALAADIPAGCSREVWLVDPTSDLRDLAASLTPTGVHYSAGPTTAASAAGALDAAATKAGVAGREDVVLVLDDSQALAPAALGALLPLLDTPGVAAAHGRAALGGRSPAGDVFDLVDHRVLSPLTAGAEAWHASAVLGAPLAVRADFLAAAGGFVCGDGVGGVACGVAGTCASLAAALAARRVGVAVTHAVCVHEAPPASLAAARAAKMERMSCLLTLPAAWGAEPRWERPLPRLTQQEGWRMYVTRSLGRMYALVSLTTPLAAVLPAVAVFGATWPLPHPTRMLAIAFCMHTLIAKPLAMLGGPRVFFTKASPLGWAKHQLAGTALWLDYGIVALKAAFTSPHRRHVGDGGRAPPATVVDSGGVAHILPPPILRPPTGGGLPLGAPLLLCLGAATAAYGGWGLHRDVIECLATSPPQASAHDAAVACTTASLPLLLASAWGAHHALWAAPAVLAAVLELVSAPDVLATAATVACGALGSVVGLAMLAVWLWLAPWTWPGGK